MAHRLNAVFFSGLLITMSGLGQLAAQTPSASHTVSFANDVTPIFKPTARVAMALP